MTEWLHFHFSPSCIGEGNGNPLQCSCLENPRDGEPGGLPSMGSHRVGHDWGDLAAAAALSQTLSWWYSVLLKMGIPGHLTCLLRNLYAGQEATVRTGHGTTDWFQTGKGVRPGCILSPCLFKLYAEYIMRNAVWVISYCRWNGNRCGLQKRFLTKVHNDHEYSLCTRC